MSHHPLTLPLLAVLLLTLAACGDDRGGGNGGSGGNSDPDADVGGGNNVVMNDAGDDTLEGGDTDAPDVPIEIVEFGLDARPSNPGCVAPARPPSGPIAVELEDAFPNLRFTYPLAMRQVPGDNGGAWVVMEKFGRLLRFEDNPDADTFEVLLDIGERVTTARDNPSDERGMLGFAFHPDYASNGEVYLSYIATVGGNTSRISRVTAREDGTLDPDSEVVLIEIPQPANNHNGGDIHFGPDGHLYIAIGDGGGSRDRFMNGQNIETPLAAILRVDVDTRDGALPYGIPADNPFVGVDGDDRIFAYGLRNVWKMSFDVATGTLYAADVGQGAQEEVDIIERGGNYGWPVREGTLCHENHPLCDVDNTFIEPVATYPRNAGRSITGGYVYHGSAIPELRGVYLYGDFVTGLLWALTYDLEGAPAPQVILMSNASIGAFAQGDDGEVYILEYGGRISRIVPAAPSEPLTFPARLTETGCVDPANPAEPAAGVLPYAINVPFWSDGADKERYFAIPDGTTVEATEQGDFIFPIGTVTMKHFRLGGQLIETRLFVRHDDGGWAGYSYRWDEDGRDATLLDGAATSDVGQQRWSFPSRAECMGCHTEAAGRTLGLEQRQLEDKSARYRTADGSTRDAYQISTLVEIGVLDLGGATAEALPALDDETQPLEQRARAYLHSNCAGCHQDGGGGRATFDLSYANPNLAEELCDVAPMFGDLGIEGATIFAPGDAARSLLLQRPRRRDADGMPPSSSDLIDTEGTALLEAWIAAPGAFCP